jgi:flavin-dependent dehydrogenase
MAGDADAVVIGAGPAGAASAILLSQAGWSVILVEQKAYPRQKVCGECLTAGSLALLDALGVGAAVRERAGPELREVGWMSAGASLVAELPSYANGSDVYGRALGRDHLDSLLVERARELGVTLLQPARVRAIGGEPGSFECAIEAADAAFTCRAPVVIDAHGSWEAGPRELGAAERSSARVLGATERSSAREPRPAEPSSAHDSGATAQSSAHDAPAAERARRRGSDLFGFKASFRNSALRGGLLPVLAFPGGYGGMVVAEEGRLTLAGCIRRDTLQAWRATRPHASAGAAFEDYVARSCRGVRDILDRAERIAPWTSVGPLRPGIRVGSAAAPFRVGNAAGETHPLIGEGITMALHSAFLLCRRLLEESPRSIDAERSRRIQRDYGAAWRGAFAPRLRLAAAYAHIAMRPALCRPAAAVLRRWPPLLTATARWAGKARNPVGRGSSPLGSGSSSRGRS